MDTVEGDCSDTVFYARYYHNGPIKSRSMEMFETDAKALL